jgi:hypothetical protein
LTPLCSCAPQHTQASLLFQLIVSSDSCWSDSSSLLSFSSFTFHCNSDGSSKSAVTVTATTTVISTATVTQGTHKEDGKRRGEEKDSFAWRYGDAMLYRVGIVIQVSVSVIIVCYSTVHIERVKRRNLPVRGRVFCGTR